MMHANPDDPPIVRFLGEDAGRGGPFALLGLPHAIQSDEQIHKARLRRLRQVDSHPHRGTPDADEVRLAIHSAASQLLDPALREQLALRWPEGTPIDLPKAWRPQGLRHRITPALLRRARLIVGTSGGWNPVARRRLAHLARVNRLSAIEVVRSLARPMPAPSNARRPAPLPALPPEPGSGRGWLAAYALLGALASFVLITVLLDPLAERRVASPGDATPAPLVDAYGLPDPDSASVERSRLKHYTAIAHELDRLVQHTTTEPEEAMARFAQVYPQLVSRWTEFPAPALRRAGANVAEFVARLDQQSVPAERIAPLLAQAGLAPDRVMIASGMIEAALATPTLRTETREMLRELRTRLSDAPLAAQGELLAGMREVADALARSRGDDDPVWWGAWLRGVTHATNDTPAEHTRLLLVALSARLTDDDTPGEEWEQTASILVPALDWRADAPERYWLIDRFHDEAVSTSRLAVLTEAIVTRSAADGVDQRFVLAPNANDPQRSRLAQQFRRVWFPDQPATGADPGDQPGDELVQALRLALVSTGEELSDADALRATLELTVLNSAAMLRLQGQAAQSMELLQNPPKLDSASSPQDVPIHSAEDDEWARRARNCTEAAQLRPLLGQLLRDGRIGINSAHALVDFASASRGVDHQLRNLALEQLTRYRDQLAVLLAVDHAISSGRVNNHMAEMVRAVLGEDLPSHKDAAWYTRARRMLLARMGRAVGRAQRGDLNALQRELTRLLQQRLGSDAPHPSGETDSDPASLLTRLNQRDRVALEDAMKRAPRLQAEAAHADTSAMVFSVRATSTMHRYLAAQRYAVQIKALLLRAEHPDTGESVAKTLRTLDQRLSRAASVMQQIAQCERAICELMLIRLQREEAP